MVKNIIRRVFSELSFTKLCEHVVSTFLSGLSNILLTYAFCEIYTIKNIRYADVEEQ